MKHITIFTPTYNRVKTLERLYKSLINQTSQDFIWLIIDDGSTDNTKEVVSNWINEQKITIEYYKQSNKGKSAAHNVGVYLTKTELFTCVDSDDYLIDTAVEEIISLWKKCKKMDIIGILTFKRKIDKEITSIKNKEICSSTLLDAYRKHGLRGDTMLIFKTDIIKKYSFPYFDNEKFVPEAYLYDLIDQEGKYIIYKRYLYICEYLSDGYSNNMSTVIKNNPNGYIAFIEQRLKIDKNLKYKILDTIRYVAICIYVKKTKFIRNSVYPFITFISLPFGYLLYFIKYKD